MLGCESWEEGGRHGGLLVGSSSRIGAASALSWERSAESINLFPSNFRATLAVIFTGKKEVEDGSREVLMALPWRLSSDIDGY